MKKISVIISCLMIAPISFAKVYDPPLSMVVKVPVADVRTKPTPHTGGYVYDELQETQVEKGEPVLVLEKVGKWARIEAPEQMEYSHNDHWQGYPGWILWSALTDNLSQLREIKRPNIPEADLRQKILDNASQHIGESYFWGGRSLFDSKNKTVLTGVDCSGLVNLSYKRAGLTVPRDAHEQYLKAHPIDPKDMKPADLFFLAKIDNPKKIVHTGLFVSDDLLLEAPQTGDKVRKISFKDRFGKTRLDLKNGDKVGDRIIYFGTLFTEGL